VKHPTTLCTINTVAKKQEKKEKRVYRNERLVYNRKWKRFERSRILRRQNQKGKGYNNVQRCSNGSKLDEVKPECTCSSILSAGKTERLCPNQMMRDKLQVVE
jgi:hypothetical protein